MVRKQTINDSANRKELSDRKIEELGQRLESNGRASKKVVINGQSQVDSLDHYLSSSDLAKSLFSKAPVEFMEQKSIDELIDITNRALEHVKKFVGGDEPVQITAEQRQDYSCLFVALGDRPFIINTITESIREFGININALIHPILLKGGYRISTSYIEIAKVSDETLNKLKQDLFAAFQDLVLFTDDFTSILVQAETLARDLTGPAYLSSFNKSEGKEVADFLRWLTDGGFICLGHVEWEIGKNGKVSKNPSCPSGLYKTPQSYLPNLLQESREDAERLKEVNDLVSITKLRTESLAHRRTRINNISIQKVSSDGRLTAVHSFIGFLTSKALSQESSTVPLIRRKLNQILHLEQVIDNSYDYKNVVNIIDSMPKDEALRLDVAALREIVNTVISIQNRNETRVSTRFDKAGRGVSVIIIMPRDRFNSHIRLKLQEHIEKAFHAEPNSSEYHLDLSNKPLVRFYFYVPLKEGATVDLDIVNLESKIAELSKTWRDNLMDRVHESFDNAFALWHRYSNAFPEGYQALKSVEDCERDIRVIETLNQEHPLKVLLSESPVKKKGLYSLTMYNLTEEFTISKALPILENVGLEVISEMSFHIAPQDSQAVYIDSFLVQAKNVEVIKIDLFNQEVAHGLEQIFLGQAEDDLLNSLLLTTELNVRAIALLRCYACLLWQINRFATRGTIYQTLASTPNLTLQLWKMFELSFDPALELSPEKRKKKFQKLTVKYRESLRDVSEITRDRILRSLANIVGNTLRTNFYADGNAIALKIASSEVEIMPEPRPHVEIFVRSPLLEGIHLRAGEIARGGIRWSDRSDDYRTEILGLMKTQNLKNALIVPSGAKGGFILTKKPDDPAQLRETVKTAYEEFIRALLSITDNRLEQEIVHPKSLVVYDNPDPYFVVAADKGTATFSDLANKIAVEEFDFWLGDAFASGGSNGYDHKKFGITARGAWESVRRHFNDLSLDYLNKPFTAIGIGDMSGDVFGNGMLLSSKIQLLAAFNHKHIFLDPAPDHAKSYEERVRLFNTPGAQWTDYNPELISAGGGVYDRFNKEIVLSPEIRQSLSIHTDVPEAVNGEMLISLILKAEVDLLWNGGIGTYVKSRQESHSDVNDGENDGVRINANELRARVVGEGGNLGFTQRARIEFAQNGGRINTDAIDNSGGVDLSDHEVNLKILFSELVRKGNLTVEKRNKLLREISKEVISHVLTHNKNHALLLTIGLARSRKNVEYFRSLISELVKSGYINRGLEFLPDDAELTERIKSQVGLSRPELAICLGGVKMQMKNMLQSSTLPDDPLLKRYLLGYFPEALQKQYGSEILAHPLGSNIIATQVTNTLVDAVGITFIHRMCLNHSVPPAIVVKCALAVELILGTSKVREAFNKYDTFAKNELFLEFRKELSKTMREATAWMISSHGQDLALDEIVGRYKKPYTDLLDRSEKVMSEGELLKYHSRLEKYSNHDFSPFVARSLALYPRITLLLEILRTTGKTDKKVKLVATIFFQIIEELEINSVLELESKLVAKNKWESELIQNSYEEIRRSISKLTQKLINENMTRPADIANALRGTTSYERLAHTIEETKGSIPSSAILSVISKQLRNYQLARPA